METKNSVGIYKYKSSNVRSLINALDLVSEKYYISENFSELLNIDRVIIPGIGNMKGFQSENSIKTISKEIRKYIDNGGLVYGICLGLQLLVDFNEEANIKTLGIINGQTIDIKKEFKINLNVGFNNLVIKKDHFNSNLLKELFNDIDIDAKFYFLHKYYCKVNDEKIRIISTKLNGKYLPSLFIKDNILGTQFHPELSKKNGLKFLKNFCNYKL